MNPETSAASQSNNAGADLHSLMRPVAEDGWEIHYAPVSGGILVMKDQTWKSSEGSDHHALMHEFLKHRASGQLVLDRTVTYGHLMFHGHTGRVDIYTWRTPA